MRRRIPDAYTVMIARTDKEPKIFSVQPIALWISLLSLMTLLLAAFLLGWSQGQSSARRSAERIPVIRRIQST
ncbi:MAG: hypothetical protein NW220_00790 [Leptolyngbyaceae cyanobacterium bins.349]|nr:hypothetical protein [Leptolyngbyaceae cyanobacterium bins.349]